MPHWPVRRRSTSSSQITIPLEEDDEIDGYVDALDEITNLSPSLHEEMQEFLRAQAKAEFSSSPTPTSPNKPWGSLSTELSKRARGDISMDADILKDPVKQKDICEMTNFNDYSPEARKRRYKRRWDVPNDADISEVVQYTDDGEADRRFKEEYERKDSEVTKRFASEEDYDDCFMPVDNSTGWVYIYKVTVPDVRSLPQISEGEDRAEESLFEKFMKVLSGLPLELPDV